MARVPTANQFSSLLSLGNGAAVLAPMERPWGPLVRHGWVEPWNDLPAVRDKGGFYPPLRITPDGFRALAAATERHGLPDLTRRRKETS
jgi:hypothetical protein